MIGTRRTAAPGLVALVLASLLGPPSADAGPTRPSPRGRSLAADRPARTTPDRGRVVPREPSRHPDAGPGLPELSAVEEDSSDDDSFDLAGTAEGFPIPGRDPIRLGRAPIRCGEIVPTGRRSIVLRC